MTSTYTFRDDRDLSRDQVIALSEAHAWSSAAKPALLLKALQGSHSPVSAWDGETLIGPR